MLVTFAEAYLQDALTLMVSGAFRSSDLPESIVQEVTGKWVKSMIHGGNPHQWIGHLKKFGTPNYPDDLPGKLQRIWNLRHAIIHTADPDTSETKQFAVSEMLKTIVTFVRATDEMLMARIARENSTKAGEIVSAG